jgi:hypothetical protein
VRLDLAAPMSARWFVSLYGDTAGAAVGHDALGGARGNRVEADDWRIARSAVAIGHCLQL